MKVIASTKRLGIDIRKAIADKATSFDIKGENYEPKKKCCGGICENCNHEEK
jgi:hypothetical protein